MKNLFKLAIVFITLTACTARQVQAPSLSATEVTQVNMPNPASVYCVQQGNTLEIRTADDGSQSGICVFSDGSSCDEWAYYRGECRPAAENSPTPAIVVEATTTVSDGNTEDNASGGYMPPGTSEEIADWWGSSRATHPARSMMTASSGRILDRSSILVSILKTQQ